MSRNTCPNCGALQAASLVMQEPPMTEQEFEQRFDHMIRAGVTEMLVEIGVSTLADARQLPTLAKVREWEASSGGPYRAVWGALADWIEQDEP